MKLKLRIEGIDYEMDGNPDELGDFVKIIKQRPRQSTIVPPVPSKFKEDTLPTVDDIVKYITTKQDYEHHTVELQEKFLGKRIKARDNTKLYMSFDKLIRNARKYIAKKDNGTWDDSVKKPLIGRTHVTVYRFKKMNEKSDNPSAMPESNKTIWIKGHVSERSTQPLENYA